MQGELKMRKIKRKSKTIFRVTCNTTPEDNEYFDLNNLVVQISKGTTGAEMGYALCALLSVVIAKENDCGNTFTTDSFLNYLGMLMKDMQVGIPKDEV